MASLQPSVPYPSNNKNFFCSYPGCKKVYNRRSKLQDHIRSHTNERPFVCPHPSCTKDFRRDSHLKHHIKSAHSGVRDNACNYEGCGKSFATGQRLRRHLAAHENNERYKCKVADCGQLYRKHATLQEHVTTDHESGPYICQEVGLDGAPCGEDFVTATKLRTHKKIHGDKESFECKEPGCGLVFDKIGKYRFHTSRAHGHNKPWTCGLSSLEKLRQDYRQNWTGQDACGRGFSTKDGFEEHILTFHLNQRHPRVDPNKKQRKRNNGASLLGRLTGTHTEESGRNPDSTRNGNELDSSGYELSSAQSAALMEATNPLDAQVGMTTWEQDANGYMNGGIEGVLDAGATIGGQFWISGRPARDLVDESWDAYMRDMDRGVEGANQGEAANGGEAPVRADWMLSENDHDGLYGYNGHNQFDGYGHNGTDGQDGEDIPIDPALL